MSRPLALVSLALSVIVATGGWLALVRADDGKPPVKPAENPAAKPPAKDDDPFATDATPVAKPAEKPDAPDPFGVQTNKQPADNPFGDAKPAEKPAEKPTPPLPRVPKTPRAPKKLAAPPRPKAVGIEHPVASAVVKRVGATFVEQVLTEVTSFDFHDTPLSDVIDEIGKRHGINVLLDSRALKEAGIAADLPVSFTSRTASLGAALRLMLGQFDLAYIAEDDTVLLITTVDKAKEKTVVRTYDVHDLIASSPPAPVNEFADPVTEADTDGLIDTITSIVAPTTWDAAGGNGTISPVDTTLVVTQTFDNQRAVAELLAALRKVRPHAGTINRSDTQFVDSNPAEVKIRERLNVRQDVDFAAAKLSDFEDYLGKQGIPVVFDKKKLQEAGVAVDASVAAFKARNVPFRFAVRQILGELDLGYVVRDEMLVITTLDAKKEATRIAVYPLGNLPNDSVVPSGSSAQDQDFNSLIGVITSAIQPQTWAAQGGNGAIAGMSTANALVVSQTNDVHEEVGKLLAKLRATRHDPKDIAANPAGELKDKNEVVVRTYMLVNNDEKAVDQVVATITTLIEPKSWSGDTAYLGKIPGGIIVRHTRAVQQRIANLLQVIQGIGSPPAGAIRRPRAQTSGTFIGGPGGAFDVPLERTTK